MNSITTLKSSPLSAVNLPASGTAQTKPLKNVLPLVSVNNENCSPNIAPHPGLSESSAEVMKEVQALKQYYLHQAIDDVKKGANCRTVADKYCIKYKGSLQKIHAASLQANKAGSVGAALGKGGNWQIIAEEHGIQDKVLLESMEAFAACIDKKQAVLKDVPAANAVENNGFTGNKLFGEVGDDKKMPTEKPENVQIRMLDAVLAHEKIISLADK